MISVASILRQKRKIKAVPCLTRLRGHYMGDQFGQELCRGTLKFLETEVYNEEYFQKRANRALIRRTFEEEVNNGNLAVIDEFAAPNYVLYSPGGAEPVRGPECLKQLITSFRTAFPDIKGTIEDMITEGDKVVVRYVWCGTHQGPWMGIPPTGKPVNFTSIDIFRIANGKVVEQWVSGDSLGLLQQLGAVPFPRRGGYLP